MLMHKRHPRLVHPRPISRQSKLRQLGLRRCERRGGITPQLCQILVLLLALELLKVVVGRRRQRDVRTVKA